MFDSVLNTLLSMHFAQTQKKQLFSNIFGTCGANVNMVIFLESFINLNGSEAASYKHVNYIKKGVLFTKINFLLSQRSRPKYVAKKINDLDQ